MKNWLSCLFVLSLCAGQAVAQGYSWDKVAPSCQILDKNQTPSYSVDLSYIADSDFSGYDSSRFMELNASLELGYYYDVLEGELDMALDFDGTWLLSSAGLQLPDQLVVLALDAGLTWRYMNGVALQVRVAPGIYGDFEEVTIENWNMPISVAGVKRFNSDVSAIAGVQVRFGFERELMPIVGVVWAPSDWLRIEATLPEAKAVYYFNDVWSANVQWAWESMTYNIREKGDYDREKVTFESYRTSLGATYSISDSLKLTGDIGMLRGRGVEFKRTADDMDNSIDISSEAFARVGLAGPF